jgi:hypothetical protein
MFIARLVHMMEKGTTKENNKLKLEKRMKPKSVANICYYGLQAENKEPNVHLQVSA